MTHSAHFSQAIADYLYLLERNYPSKSMLKLVGDKYALPAHERIMLYRGLATEKVLAGRKHKKTLQLTAGVPITIDGFNVCRTVGSYLSGNFVFEGLDGFLRDVSEIHRKKLGWEILVRSVDLIVKYLKSQKTGNVVFYFDKPLSHSGKMAALCGDILNKYGMPGHAETVYSPDYCLIKQKEGIICTADSYVIDSATVYTFDLAKSVLYTNFHPSIFNLKDFVGEL